MFKSVRPYKHSRCRRVEENTLFCNSMITLFSYPLIFSPILFQHLISCSCTLFCLNENPFEIMSCWVNHSNKLEMRLKFCRKDIYFQNAVNQISLNLFCVPRIDSKAASDGDAKGTFPRNQFMLDSYIFCADISVSERNQ